MSLPFFSKNKNKSDLFYFGIFLKEEEGIGTVMAMKNGAMTIIEKEHFVYSNGWENIIQDIDELLFKFEQHLHISLDKTIFFVYSHFIDEKLDDIKRPYLQKIKEIVKNLELHALGYIECIEAVLTYLQKKEEMPLTAIVTELDKTNTSINVYKGGRKVYTKLLARTNNLVDDFLNCFEELNGKLLLPARIILYDSKNLDDESTKILTHHWSENYFIQIPRVEILKEEEILEALMNVFEEQILKNITVQPRESVEPSQKEVMGFILDKDIQEVRKTHVEKVELFYLLKKNLKHIWQKLKIPAIKRPSILNISKKIFIIGGALIILLSIFLNEILLHKAKLTVFLPSQRLQKQFTINDLQIMISTSSANYNDSKATTGIRNVGEQAKGSVTFSSFDDQGKMFAKGTILTTGSIQFSLDDDVKVASSSLTTDGSAKLPGKNNGSVTAVNIGPESNIAKGQHFTIDKLSPTTYFAINDTAFSGGSKKQIQTVSKQDLDDLIKSLKDKAKIQKQNQNDIDQTEEIIQPLSKINLRDLKFSKEVGEESSEISLQATADYENYFIKKDELVTKILKVLNPDVQQGFSIDRKNTHYTIDKVDKNDKTGVTTLSLTVNTKAVKEVSQLDILKDVEGKNKNEIESILKKKYNVDGYELNIQDSLPVLNLYTPFIKKNIQLIISSL